MDVSIDTSQIEALTGFFNELREADKKKIYAQGFRRASKPLVEATKSLVPRRRGTLAGSIGTIYYYDDVSMVMGARKKYKGNHGHLIENGTVERFRRSKTGTGRTGKVIGVHFIERAYNATEDKVMDAIEGEWLHAIDRAITRINKKY